MRVHLHFSPLAMILCPCLAFPAGAGDPGEWLREVTDDSKAKSKMTFRLARGGEDMAACLATFPAEAVETAD